MAMRFGGWVWGFNADESGVGFDVAVRNWSLADGVVYAGQLARR